MKIAICEDQWLDAQVLCEQVRRYLLFRQLELEICWFDSGEALLDQFAPGKFPVVFMDIYLRQMSGMETARRIRAEDEACAIVFTTSSDAHAVEGFAVRAAHYLVKPVAYMDLCDAMERCREQLDRFARTVEVIQNRIPVRLRVRDIRYVEAERRSATIHMADENVAVYMTLDELEALLAGESFLRCHRSYIVNLRWVKAMHKDYFEMVDDSRVFISRRLYARTRHAYTQYVDNLFTRTRAY